MALWLTSEGTFRFMPRVEEMVGLGRVESYQSTCISLITAAR